MEFDEIFGGGHFCQICVCVCFFELVYLHHRDMGEQNMTKY